MTPTIAPRRLWWLSAGFGVWCLALVVLYALHAIGCAFGWPAGALRSSLVLVFVAHLVVIGWISRFTTSAATIIPRWAWSEMVPLSASSWMAPRSSPSTVVT